MRRKDIVVCFKEIFGSFLTDNGYRFNKSGFIKFENDVFICVSIYSRKVMGMVEFDIIHECTPIFEPFSDNLTTDNEDGDFSLGRIVFSKGLTDNIWWKYEYKNSEMMREKIQEAFGFYQNYYDEFFDINSVSEFKIKEEIYSSLLESDLSDDKLENIFVGNFEDESLLPQDSLAMKYKDRFFELLFFIRYDYYDLYRYLEEYFSSHKVSDEFDLDYEYVKKLIDSCNKDKKLINALLLNDEEYVLKIFSEEENQLQKIIESNKKILKKFGMI